MGGMGSMPADVVGSGEATSAARRGRANKARKPGEPAAHVANRLGYNKLPRKVRDSANPSLPHALFLGEIVGLSDATFHFPLNLSGEAIGQAGIGL